MRVDLRWGTLSVRGAIRHEEANPSSPPGSHDCLPRSEPSGPVATAAVPESKALRTAPRTLLIDELQA
jgi:hypothetical protein